MRGADILQESLCTLRKRDDLVPASHPLRPICERVNLARVRLDSLFAQSFHGSPTRQHLVRNGIRWLFNSVGVARILA